MKGSIIALFFVAGLAAARPIRNPDDNSQNFTDGGIHAASNFDHATSILDHGNGHAAPVIVPVLSNVRYTLCD